PVPTLLIHDFVGVSGIRATTGGLPLQENETALTLISRNRVFRKIYDSNPKSRKNPVSSPRK
ncbi:MAG: hypothetical protein WBL95_10130, partial [Microcoleus sp.]